MCQSLLKVLLAERLKEEEARQVRTLRRASSLHRPQRMGSPQALSLPNGWPCRDSKTKPRGPYTAKARAYIFWDWCHLRDTLYPGYSHSREGGNPLRKPLEIRRRRTGFPPSRE